jgi:paraquat-inducible protein A
MTPRNILAVVLTVISLGLLWPGLTEPVLTITASMSFLGASREVFRQTQSIVESVRNLRESGNNFVAGLILLFSIIVPFIKAVLLIAIVAIRRHDLKRRLFLFVRSVSKWAMADVFVVGVLISYLAAKATDNLDAVAGTGFYFFAAYCLVSNFSFQALDVPETPGASPAR